MCKGIQLAACTLQYLARHRYLTLTLLNLLIVLSYLSTNTAWPVPLEVPIALTTKSMNTIKIILTTKTVNAICYTLTSVFVAIYINLPIQTETKPSNGV